MIQDVSVAAVLELLHFLYTNNLSIANPEQGIDLLYLSNYYGIKQLQHAVENKLICIILNLINYLIFQHF